MIRKWILASVVIFIVAVVAWIIWDNNRMVTTEYVIESDRVAQPMEMIQISDFHMCARFGDRLMETVEEDPPDLIAITGDYLDGGWQNYEYSLDLARRLTKICPVYFVTGNHEIVDLTSTYRGELESLGVEILSGEKATVGDGIDLYGIEDPDLLWGTADTSTEIIINELKDLDVDEDRFSILLSHRPEAFRAYVDKGFDLVLTGHTHGGQVRIPFVGGVIAPDQGFFPEYDSGRFDEGKTTMIVSRGIGNSLAPVRVNNPAELVILKIRPR